MAMALKRIEVFRQGLAVFVDRVYAGEASGAGYCDRLFAGHIDQWADALRFAHDTATRDGLRWGFWRYRWSDGRPEFFELTGKEDWRRLAEKPPQHPLHVWRGDSV
jgi:hypothetical protein